MRNRAMTFGIKTITGVVTATTRKGFFGTVVPLWGADWGDKKLGGWCPMTFEPWTVNDVWVYMVGELFSASWAPY